MAALDVMSRLDHDAKMIDLINKARVNLEHVKVRDERGRGLQVETELRENKARINLEHVKVSKGEREREWSRGGQAHI
jgi:hypothetical protein